MKVVLSIFIWIMMGIFTVAVFLATWSTVIFLFPFDRQGKLAHAQGFWWADALIGINPFWKLSIKGLENIDPSRTYVLVANHQSLVDIVMVYKTRLQFKWVGKEVLFRIPIFGWTMSGMKYIRLTRGELGSIKKVYEQAAGWLRQGVSVLFFPEGTRSSTDKMVVFKNGAFKLAIREKKPILPISIEGSHEVLPKGKWVFKRRAVCALTVLPAIETDDLAAEDFALLKDKVRVALASAVS